MNTRHRTIVATFAPLLAVALAAVAGCGKETRVLAADQPQTPPVRTGDPRIPRYQENRYQISQGGRYFAWYGCTACHASGAANGLDLQQSRRHHGDGFDEVYRFIADAHPQTEGGRYGDRIPVEQIWQLTAYVRDLPTIDPALRRRQDIDQAGEPQGARWSGPVR